MDVSLFISRYQKALKNRVEDISIALTSGSASNMETYRASVGEIQGITFALEELHSLLEKANYVEDIDST